MNRRSFSKLIAAAIAALLFPFRKRAVVGQFRAKYTVASKPVHTEFGFAVFYTLMQKNGKWQWRTMDGKIEMSPLLDSKQAAVDNGARDHCIQKSIV